MSALFERVVAVIEQEFFNEAFNDYDVGEQYRLMLPFAEMRSGKGVLLEGTGVEPLIVLDIADLDDIAMMKLLGERKLIPSFLRC